MHDLVPQIHQLPPYCAPSGTSMRAPDAIANEKNSQVGPATGTFQSRPATHRSASSVLRNHDQSIVRRLGCPDLARAAHDLSNRGARAIRRKRLEALGDRIEPHDRVAGPVAQPDP